MKVHSCCTVRKEVGSKGRRLKGAWGWVVGGGMEGGGSIKSVVSVGLAAFAEGEGGRCAYGKPWGWAWMGMGLDGGGGGGGQKGKGEEKGGKGKGRAW